MRCQPRCDVTYIHTVVVVVVIVVVVIVVGIEYYYVDYTVVIYAKNLYHQFSPPNNYDPHMPLVSITILTHY